MGPLRNNPPESVDFLEVAPENWIGVGGKLGKDFRTANQSFQLFLLRCSQQQDAKPSALLARHIGFVFQQFHLLSGYTALDNVADPHQLENIAEDQPEVVDRLIREELIPWLHRTGDPWREFP